MHIETSSQTLSVYELNRAIKMALEPSFASIKVKGEVSDARLQSSGHEYFTIKDDKSQISCVLFKGSRTAKDTPLKPGDQIVIEGGISLYEPRGQYQIIARKITRQGVGDLLAKIHALKKELESLGWFSKERKKTLPPFPKRIGVITSPTGSVIRDIIHVLSRRFSGFHLILYPVKVQGVGAAEEIAKAIGEMNRFDLADLLIIARGGGSLEDLMPFNERCVAEALFNSRIPTISAVGHETDISMSDFVADIRAPTPSAAAEIATAEKAALLYRLEETKTALARHTLQKIHSAKSLLKSVKLNKGISDPFSLLYPFSQKLDDKTLLIQESIALFLKNKKRGVEGFTSTLSSLNPERRLKEQAKGIAILSHRLHEALERRLSFYQKKLDLIGASITSINPKKLLSRGYSISFAQKDNSVIISKSQVIPGDKITLMLSDGFIDSTIDAIRGEKP